MVRTALRLAPVVALFVFVAGGCSSGDSAPLSQTCVHPTDCDSPLTCLFEKCTPICNGDRDCQSGSRCIETKEVSGCVTDVTASCNAGCPDGTQCSAGTCRTSCGTQEDLVCLAGQACVGAVCIGTDATHDMEAVSTGGSAGGAGAPASAGNGGAHAGVGGSMAGANSAGGLGGTAGAGGASGAAGKGGAGASGGGGHAGSAGLGGGAGNAGSAGIGGASGSSGAAGSSGAGGGTLGPEDCFNGKDDNGDTLIDCADPMCTSVAACALPVPVGFTGPVAVWVGPAAAVPVCPETYGVELMTGTADLSCADATCSCKCGTPKGVACINDSLYWNPTSTCPNGNNTTTQGPSTTCQTVNTPGAKHVSMFATGPIPSGGTCTPNPATPILKNAVWATKGRICSSGLLEGGCLGGTECAPIPPQGFAICVYAEGDIDCESKGYTTKQVLYTGEDDNRGCTTCTCDGAMGGTCTHTIDLYSGAGCTGVHTSVSGTSCAAVSSPTSFKFEPSYDNDGKCNATIAPKGACTPTGPVTVCCAK